MQCRHSAHIAPGTIRDTEYDVTISDYDMREMNGIALIRHLKQSGIQTPFILMTGVGGEEIEAEACLVRSIFSREITLPGRSQPLFS